MTTDLSTGKQIPVCEKHNWTYMKTLHHPDGREMYMMYCPVCGQKTAHIPDYSEEEFVKMAFEDYDKKGMRRSKPSQDETKSV